ncbi:hypothetical protein PsorP6_016275 [Peronosclerospora sorghi]|uniref:Uncharacterized protein n=1 Tax=Peronosclerospora sorghi TaxID=230839 RepID=A0ACC0VQ32_9STRA|nr:hypothetical protein PsorP6_016275 [Peronosclerospora sorghi]
MQSGGTPEQVAEEDRLRKGATTLSGCPFLLYARILKDGIWHLTAKCGEHNHPPALDIAGHAAARRLTKKQRQVVSPGIKAGSAPRDILTGLRLENRNTLAHARTVYNERYKLRKDELNGRETMQALLDELIEKNYQFNSKNLFCRWHIAKNLLKNFRKHFESIEEWGEFINTWIEALAYFKEQFSTVPEAILYIENQWIPPSPDPLRLSLTNLFLHFNNINTSRRRYSFFHRKVFQGVDSRLMGCMSTLVNDYASTVAELRAAVVGNSIKVWSDHDDEFYSEIFRRVSGYALAKVQYQVKLLQDLDNEAECSGVFTTTWGLPCAHTIESRKQSGGILHMGDFHDQWHLKTICLFNDHPFPATGMQGDVTDFEILYLVRKVQETYSSLVPHQQMAMQMQLSHMVSQTFHFANPPAACPKGRPKGSLNRRPPGSLGRSRSSTQRSASGFDSGSIYRPQMW